MCMCVTQIQHQKPEWPTVTLTWHACKYKVHKLHQRYILTYLYHLTSDNSLLTDRGTESKAVSELQPALEVQRPVLAQIIRQFVARVKLIVVHVFVHVRVVVQAKQVATHTHTRQGKLQTYTKLR